MDSEQPKILSKEDFFRAAAPASELFPLGDGHIRIRGISVKEYADIDAGAHSFDSKGERKYDAYQDRILTLVAVIADPPITLMDTAFLDGIADGTADQIIQRSAVLSKRALSHFEALKSHMRTNPLLRRLYTVCVEKLGRFPSELDHISEAEFNTYLAAAEVEAEEAAAQAREDMGEKDKAPEA